MLVLEVCGDVDTMDHFLNYLFVDRLFLLLLSLSRGFLLVDLNAVRKQTSRILLS